MPLKLSPTGLSSGIDKDRPDYSVYAASGMSVVSTKPAVPKSALVLVDDGQRSDDALGSRGDLEGSEGAASPRAGRRGPAALG